MPTIFVILLVSLLLFLASAAPAQQPTLKPVATVKQLMKAIVIPSSDAVFQVAAKEPKNEEQWAAVQNSALALAEAGNLLMIGSRAKDRGEWMKQSQALVDLGTVAVKAAEAKDVDAVSKAGDEIYNVCESCHNKYMEKTNEAK